MRYFAMLDDESVRILPGAATFDEAAELEPQNTHWIFSEAGLAAFVSAAQAALSEGGAA